MSTIPLRDEDGDATDNRTPVCTLKGCGPGPLDDSVIKFLAESRVSKLKHLRARTVFEAGSGTRPELLSVNWLPHQDSNLDHRVNSPGSCQLNDTGTKNGLPYGNRTRLVPVNSRLLSQRSVRARLVCPEGIEPSSPTSQVGVLPFNYGHILVRPAGIEPAPRGWEPGRLPLSYGRERIRCTCFGPLSFPITGPGIAVHRNGRGDRNRTCILPLKRRLQKPVFATPP